MFELVGGEVFQSRMATSGVVVAFDVFEEVVPCLGFIGKGLLFEEFLLESADEGLAPGVVIGVGSPRHALGDAMACQQSTKGSTTILAASVAVEDKPLRVEPAGGQRVVHGLADQITPEVVIQMPTDNLPRV